MVQVELRRDSRRGCGWRKPGLYLVADGPSQPCGKLPLPLEICPTCGNGIKPARAWTWVNATALFAGRQCRNPNCSGRCPLAGNLGRAGLLWIGVRYYPTPDAWLREAEIQGISRRIPAVPKGFESGKTWVLVAHQQATRNADGSFAAAIFRVFRPSAIEYVVRGDESAEELERLAKRGVTPVRIERIGGKAETAPLF